MTARIRLRLFNIIWSFIHVILYYYYHSNWSGDGNILGSKNIITITNIEIMLAMENCFFLFFFCSSRECLLQMPPKCPHVDIRILLEFCFVLFCCSRIKMLELSDLTTPVRCTPTPIWSNHTHCCVRCMELQIWVRDTSCILYLLFALKFFPPFFGAAHFIVRLIEKTLGDT